MAPRATCRPRESPRPRPPFGEPYLQGNVGAVVEGTAAHDPHRRPRKHCEARLRGSPSRVRDGVKAQPSA
eukprot:998690-Pyramimonas_sp.AAC.1